MPSLVEIGSVVLDKRFSKFVYVFSLFHNYLPLERDGGPSFQQTWIPFTLGCFVPSLVEIGPVVLEKKIKMWKVYENNDDDRQRKNFDQKSSLEPSAQVSWKFQKYCKYKALNPELPTVWIYLIPLKLPSFFIIT